MLCASCLVLNLFFVNLANMYCWFCTVLHICLWVLCIFKQILILTGNYKHSFAMLVFFYTSVSKGCFMQYKLLVSV